MARLSENADSKFAVRHLPTPQMKISTDTGKAIGLILIYTALLCFLVGVAADHKSDFHSRAVIFRTGLVTAAVLAALGVITFLFSSTRKQD